MRTVRLTAIAGVASLAAGCLVLLAGTVVTRSGDGAPERDKWKAEYVRPSAIPFPDNNPYTEAKSRLGRMLFFEPALSGSGTRSCASCHNPGLSWQDNLPRGIGDTLEAMATRTPTLLNVAWVPKLAWDGHFRDLESVAFGPITNPKIMNAPEKLVIERLSAIPGYVSAFNVAFGPGAITRRKAELALATFERSIVSGEAPFDRWIKGDERAISDAAKRGFDLFNGKANCAACHSGWSFSDASFHDIGVGTGDDQRFDRGHDTDPDHDQIGGDDVAVGQPHAALGHPRRHLPGRQRITRGLVDEDRSLARRVHQSLDVGVPEQHLPHVIGGGEAQEYDVTPAGEVAQVGRRLRAELDERPDGPGVAVVDHEGSGLLQSLGEGSAHVAEPDISDLHDILPRIAISLVLRQSRAQERVDRSPAVFVIEMKIEAMPDVVDLMKHDIGGSRPKLALLLEVST